MKPYYYVHRICLAIDDMHGAHDTLRGGFELCRKIALEHPGGTVELLRLEGSITRLRPDETWTPRWQAEHTQLPEIYRVYAVPAVGRLRQHHSLSDARAEACRLANKQPNDVFEILSCIAITSLPPATPSTFWMDGEQPPTTIQKAEKPIEQSCASCGHWRPGLSIDTPGICADAAARARKLVPFAVNLEAVPVYGHGGKDCPCYMLAEHAASRRPV